jgi:hypothetical protein
MGWLSLGLGRPFRFSRVLRMLNLWFILLSRADLVKMRKV